MHSDSYFYVRLGYGRIFSDRVYGKPAIGFGHRTELDTFAIDVSFLNAQLDSYNGYSATSSATAASLLKLEGLYFVHSRANATSLLRRRRSVMGVLRSEVTPTTTERITRHTPRCAAAVFRAN